MFLDITPISRFAPGEVKQLIFEIKMLPDIPPSRPFTVTPTIAAAMARADCDREVISIQHNELTNELFDHLWAREDPYPLVITPVPGQKLLQYPWTPAFFTNIIGTTPCKAQDCETGKVVSTTVGDFYRLFGTECNTRPVLRLKVSCYFAISPCTFGLSRFSLGLSFIGALPDHPPIFLPSSRSDECDRRVGLHTTGWLL
jgi:[histone H3]-dimethyl-L-lysine9 demethylase